jgi:hypothetical protein
LAWFGLFIAVSFKYFWYYPTVVPAGAIRAPQGRRPGLWVPRTSSSLRDQAILVDQTTYASLSPDAVLLKIDRFGQRFQRRRAVQETVRPVLVHHFTDWSAKIIALTC